METGAADSRIGFATDGDETWKVWDRYLTVNGKRAYHLGNVCQTCRILFERMDGANTSVTVEGVAEVLRCGVSTISDSVVKKVSMGLPTDDYLVCLADASPQLVRPGEPDDYFMKENVDLWGIEAFWDLPHDPRVPYYRVGEPAALEKGAKLIHLVIPMFPERWLKKDVISDYVSQLKQGGGVPTAIAISLLDVKAPCIWEGAEVETREHWVLSHFLIDGHHKVAAARAAGLPIRLMSFISLKNGISTREQIERAVEVSSSAFSAPSLGGS